MLRRKWFFFFFTKKKKKLKVKTDKVQSIEEKRIETETGIVKLMNSREVYWENQRWGGHCRTFQTRGSGSKFLHKAGGGGIPCRREARRYRSSSRRNWTPPDNEKHWNFHSGKSSNTLWASTEWRRIWWKKSPWRIQIQKQSSDDEKIWNPAGFYWRRERLRV